MQHPRNTATTPSQYASIEISEGRPRVVDARIDAVTVANMSTQKRPAVAAGEWTIAFHVERSAGHAGLRDRSSATPTQSACALRLAKSALASSSEKLRNFSARKVCA